MKVFRMLQSYLIYSFPFVVFCMGWSTLSPEKQRSVPLPVLKKIAWEILSWNLMLWFATLVVFLVILLVSQEGRQTAFKRLARLKDRDEREELITGEASKSAYVATLSLISFFLFFSVVTINVYRVPQKEAVNGKTGTVSVGLKFDLLDKPFQEQGSGADRVYFASQGYSLSKTALLLILLFWQLCSFNLAARKLERS